MAYLYRNSKGDTYYLNGQVVRLKNGRDQQIYFFTREPREGKALEALPSGYEVNEGVGSGLPVLRRIKTS
ncbi:MAG: hypothetical protein M1296_06890 [Chloroflexi bacterium]|nr:hypothetical protein [Chloroflexota bacterium]MCL4544948.1 hypothetical protein [Chloroflexota bacterium]